MNIAHKNEAKCLNILLMRIPQKYRYVTILESWKEMSEMDPQDIFENDKFHLDTDKEGTTIMAQKIMNHTQGILSDTPAK